MGPDDAALLRASLDDPRAFSALFDRHHSVIWGYLARLGGRELADELAGDVFVTAFARRRSFDPALGDVRPWLYGIATNLWRTRARSLARGRRALARVPAPTDSEDPTERSIARLDARVTMSAVLDALAQLRDDDREILVLHAWEGLAYGDLAHALDIPVGTVRSRLSRARARLRELLPPSGEDLDDSTPTFEGRPR